MTRKKIAILGGGLGALTTAYALTSRPFWKRHYDITVYQLGWRLGGKCASARQNSIGDRNLEHGLHVWLGSYHNAFRMLRDCYAHADWDTHSALGTVDEALAPQSEVPCMDYFNGQWYFWPLKYPHHPGKPGEGFLRRFSVWKGVRETLVALHQHHADFHDKAGLSEATYASPADSFAGVNSPPADALEAAHHLAHSMSDRASRHKPEQHESLLRLLGASRDAHQDFYENHPPKDPMMHRLWVMLDLGIAVVRGILADGVLLHGHESIDNWEFRDWLRHHGAHESTLSSGIVRELYDAGFSYRDGVTGSGIGTDWGNAELAAGTAIYCILQVSINYSGSVCYELNAGMGEVVVAPMYCALRDAGVNFEFFQNVKELKLDDSETGVEEIHIGQQVELADGRYDPLEHHPSNGIPTWPHEPFKSQIENSNAIDGINLESYWNGWTDAAEKVLRRGHEFDQVVIGISIASLPTICRDMVKSSGAVGEKWRQMFDAIGTTQTQAAQLWLNCSLDQTGWDAGAVPVDAGPEPYDVWADVNQVMKTESWPANGPKSLHYLCGPLAGNCLNYPPDDTNVPVRAKAELTADLIDWMESNAHAIWPNLQTADGKFDWNALYDPENRQGSERLEAQYLRANIDPSERYVLSLPGSSQFRLDAGGTLLDNVVVAGDWARTPFNAGNVEATVLSGLAASHAVAERCESFWVRLLGNIEAKLWKHGLWSRRGRSS